MPFQLAAFRLTSQLSQTHPKTAGVVLSVSGRRWFMGHQRVTPYQPTGAGDGVTFAALLCSTSAGTQCGGVVTLTGREEFVRRRPTV